MEDIKCFASFIHKLRPVLRRDKALCIAPLPKWCYQYDTVLKTTKIKMRSQLLPQAPFVSPQVLQRSSVTNTMYEKTTSSSFEPVMNEFMSISMLCLRIEFLLEIIAAFHGPQRKYINLFLAFHQHSLKTTILLPMFVRKRLCFGN